MRGWYAPSQTRYNVSMNVLVLGSGGREHALAWKLKDSPDLGTLYVAPGNAGTAEVAENLSLDPADHKKLIEECRKRDIGLVVVGADEYLAAGVVDALADAGILAFGPTKAAAEIEWSKAYAKEVMEAAGIPTAQSATFTEEAAALSYVNAQGAPIVVKASGLALGKGVVVAETLEEAEQAVRECFSGKFGEAGKEIVVEEYLRGVEFSAHALCDGAHALMFPSAQDHKRIGEGDTGPNTGGMGTVAPLPLPDEVMERVRDGVVMPLLQELQKRGRPFKGVLFPGIMLTSEGPKVLEFNARFGDPETQSYMRLLKSDLLPLLLASARGDLLNAEAEWSTCAVASVVLASAGYPGAYEKGKEIRGVEEAEAAGAVVFHAGTKRNGHLATNGGRVLAVSATGMDLKSALHKAYQDAALISFDGAQHRRDLGAHWL